MVVFCDGPASASFVPVRLSGNTRWDDLSGKVSEAMAGAAIHAPQGAGVSWGIPFQIDDAVVLVQEPISVSFTPLTARWFIFLHTSDIRPVTWNSHGFISPMSGAGQLNEHAADYILLYEDGSEYRASIRRRHQIGAFTRGWGENCFQAVAHRKPHPVRAHHEQTNPGWGRSQTRADSADWAPWTNWLWACDNPYPEKAVCGVRFEPVNGTLVISALSTGTVSEHPLRWRSRRKARVVLPAGSTFTPDLNECGLLSQFQLDMGQIISAQPRLIYPDAQWETSYNNQLPERSATEILIEYTSHPHAQLHLKLDSQDDLVVPVSSFDDGALSIAPESSQITTIASVPSATQRVTIRVTDRNSGKPVAVKLHVHGTSGEYLAPVDRHRIVNGAWYEDYSVDFTHRQVHQCTYINGETVLDLPPGRVYLEISKGFEIRPVRKIVDISADTTEINIELERVLPWRNRGWITADTHVHFLSPISALLEGAAEGVNVVNLLASQWGELMTNVGDFDGIHTWGSRETGGEGEYLVRVGTENRQHIMGHISLLGYRGPIIAPMTTGGPDESALGDPIEILLTEWARKCHQQGGLVVLPHFPNPRAEHAASIISGDIDAVEMTSWGDLYSGINPYNLSDWYRYLNCGYLVPAVGGTDKMTAQTAVGTVRTYARVPDEREFTYDAWMEAVKRGETFVTFGPLLEFTVDGKPMGSRITMSATGGTVDVAWQIASVTVPATQVELVVNGEIRESTPVAADGAAGFWTVKLGRSSWLALLVRGQYHDKPEMIAAHSSPVMVDLEGSPMLAAADAVTILEQIEGAVAYLDTIGTRAEDRAYKRMRLVLESVHRTLHNRLHRMGYFHNHTPVTDHPAHHR